MGIVGLLTVNPLLVLIQHRGRFASRAGKAEVGHFWCFYGVAHGGSILPAIVSTPATSTPRATLSTLGSSASTTGILRRL